LYATGGVTLSAALTYAIGRRMGHDALRRMAGSRLERISQRLGRHGLLAMIAIRVIPVAPFSIVNMAAGASHISFRHFMLGTVIGMTPGIVATVVFADQLSATLRHPGVESFALLGLAAAAAIGAAVYLKRRFSTGVGKKPPAGKDADRAPAREQ
jgi:phospholipase D1/2